MGINWDKIKKDIKKLQEISEDIENDDPDVVKEMRGDQRDSPEIVMRTPADAPDFETEEERQAFARGIIYGVDKTLREHDVKVIFDDE